ncbi:MAG: hypothetical protein ACI81O_000675 [Cyclobacteriaceae bacterium]|jgi:hypothetical protein
MTKFSRCLTFAQRRMKPYGAIILMLGLLAGCVQQPLIIDNMTPAGLVIKPSLTPACRVVLSEWQALRHRAGVKDGQVRPVGPGKVFAVDRLLASYYTELDSAAARQYWLTQAWQIAHSQRQIEYRNLPQTPVGIGLAPDFDADLDAIEACALQVLADAQVLALNQPLALGVVQVPDDYRTWARVLGIYPLSRLIVLPRIQAEQAGAREHFQQQALADTDQRYQPAVDVPALSIEAISLHLSQARSNNPLGIPQLDAPTLRAFRAHYAPAWAIGTHSRNDQPGAPRWLNERQISVDVAQPTLYFLPSYTRFQGQVLLQLNYFIWFAQRPKAHWLDLYGGELDGLVWRVTLLPDGQVLAYDSIHQCGCYHQFFAVDPGLQARTLTADQEPVLLLNDQIPDARQERVMVQLSDTDHAIVGLRVSQAPRESVLPATKLVLRDYNELRQLPLGAGQQSLFASNGLIPASRRLERWVLWPMGVASAGAMRQWGRHATAFIGRRHFDDPWLLDGLLEYGGEAKD